MNPTPHTQSDRLVSIIICTRNRCEDLRATLEALGCLQVPAGLQAELLVVDNGSTDDTRHVVQSASLPRLKITYCLEPNPGLSKARNTGMARARGELFLFTDDDVRPPPNWIEEMCSPILSAEALAVSGGVKLAPHLERKWMLLMHRSWLASSDRIDPNQPEDMVGANMALARDVLERVPGFDPELGAGALGFGEETLFSWQLLEAGIRIAGALHCSVVHFFEQSRLQRRHWRAAARKHGQTQAYLLHHWRHAIITKPLARYFLILTKITRRYVNSHKDLYIKEGCAHWETSLIEELSRYRQYIIERRRPRNYDKRGLIKLRGVLPAKVPSSSSHIMQADYRLF